MKQSRCASVTIIATHVEDLINDAIDPVDTMPVKAVVGNRVAR